MEMHERIKNLRKNHLKLTQEAFGERLGVSRSVINNIERNVLARPEQKLSLIKLICKEFSVNEDWILNGNEPIYVETVTFSLDEFMKQRGATELELQIVKTYFDLEPDTRKMLFDHFKMVLLLPMINLQNQLETPKNKKSNLLYKKRMNLQNWHKNNSFLKRNRNPKHHL